MTNIYSDSPSFCLMYVFHDSIIGFVIAFGLGSLKEHRRGVFGVHRYESLLARRDWGDGSGQRSRRHRVTFISASSGHRPRVIHDCRLSLLPAPLAGLGSVRRPTVRPPLPPSALCCPGGSPHGRPALKEQGWGAGCRRRPRDDKAEAGLQVLGWKAMGRPPAGPRQPPGVAGGCRAGGCPEGVALPQRGLSPVVETSDFRPPEP